MNKRSLTNTVITLIVVISGFLFSSCSKSSTYTPVVLTEQEKREQEGRDALAAKKAEYTAIPAKEQLAKEPYRKKSLVFYRFDKDNKDDKWSLNSFGTDKFGSSLYPAANKKLESKLAKNPDEVGIIALLPECKSVQAGQYGSVAAAFMERCELVLIDRELSAVVYRKTFDGELDRSKSLGKDEKSVTAKVDGMQIVDFLDSLAPVDQRSPQKTDKK